MWQSIGICMHSSLFVSLFIQSIEVIQDFCRAHGVSYLVILKDSDGSVNLKVIVYLRHAVEKKGV